MRRGETRTYLGENVIPCEVDEGVRWRSEAGACAKKMTNVHAEAAELIQKVRWRHV